MIDQKDFQEALGQLTRASGGGRSSSSNRQYTSNPFPTTSDGIVIRDTVRSNTGATYTIQQARQARAAANRINPSVAEDSAVATAGFGDISKPLLIGGAIVAGIIMVKSLKGKEHPIKNKKNRKKK
ncbi:hypothetical protein [Catalinimonas niigatensis]|uniref:hypothetical protein n=1 Tax=Catalinimonas niigatensis TaxID=1397264 RepID=UPI002666313A|nr:hypothetical protein [Catalinimonas niigatensis]WPP48964.1 hypothetical protein PZB72_20055 [Catalinimonas niigatensis]